MEIVLIQITPIELIIGVLMKNNSKTRKQQRRERFQKRIIDQTIQDMDLLKDDEASKHLKEQAQERLERNKERLVELGMS